jgi:diadenosine tetraphosphate (Ap4A) HIT family hydrolase
MKDGIEIYVRKSGDNVLLMFHVPDDQREAFIQGLAKGSFEDDTTDMHVEMHVLPHWRSDDSLDHLRFRVNRISITT